MTRELQLFCFANAGGAGSTFRRWGELVPASFEVSGVQLPGREQRRDEPFATDMGALAVELAATIADAARGRFALFGHSVGALLAFECARELRRNHGLLPDHLFVAAMGAPHLARTVPTLHDQDEAALIDRLRRMGGLPDALLGAPPLLQLLMPRIRADLQLFDTHVFRPEAPLACRVTALGGAQDPTVPRDYLSAWHEHTTGAFEVRVFPGDHFFVETGRVAVVATVVAALGMGGGL